MKKTILALQIPSIVGNIEENFRYFSKKVDEILKDKEIDFLFLPEVWSVGWYTKNFTKLADDTNTTVDFLSNIAQKHNTNIFGGSFIRKTQGGLKNSCPVILRNGDLLGYYDKIHLYTPDGEGCIQAGDTPYVFEIENLKIAMSICYDIRFPELFRSYINCDTQPDLLVNLSAWPLTRKEQYKLMAGARAVENQSYFLALSQCGEIKDGVYNAGNSCFYDPMGNLISHLDENEGCILSTIDTNLVQNTRNTYPNLENRKVFDFGFNPKIIKAENCEVKLANN